MENGQLGHGAVAARHAALELRLEQDCVIIPAGVEEELLVLGMI